RPTHLSGRRKIQCSLCVAGAGQVNPADRAILAVGRVGYGQHVGGADLVAAELERVVASEFLSHRLEGSLEGRPLALKEEAARRMVAELHVTRTPRYPPVGAVAQVARRASRRCGCAAGSPPATNSPESGAPDTPSPAATRPGERSRAPASPDRK